jgi:4-hydroxy-3-polyprenylbenzoate decarboxylase
MKKIILAITGASGSLYAVEFLKLLGELEAPPEIHGIISEAGRQVLQLELGYSYRELDQYLTGWHDSRDFAAPMSSGSSRFEAMVILPCSMGTLAAIANGISGNLIHRAADVMLKEKRTLLISPRETPLNLTHLKNMRSVHEAGAIVCPPMPSFYLKPRDLTEMARNFAGRVAELIGLSITGLPRWEGAIREE